MEKDHRFHCLAKFVLFEACVVAVDSTKHVTDYIDLFDDRFGPYCSLPMPRIRMCGRRELGVAVDSEDDDRTIDER